MTTLFRRGLLFAGGLLLPGFSWTGVIDIGLEHLKRSSSLQVLDLTRTRVAASWLQERRASLPEATIVERFPLPPIRAA